MLVFYSGTSNYGSSLKPLLLWGKGVLERFQEAVGSLAVKQARSRWKKEKKTEERTRCLCTWIEAGKSLHQCWPSNWWGSPARRPDRPSFHPPSRPGRSPGTGKVWSCVVQQWVAQSAGRYTLTTGHSRTQQSDGRHLQKPQIMNPTNRLDFGQCNSQLQMSLSPRKVHSFGHNRIQLA